MKKLVALIIVIIAVASSAIGAMFVTNPTAITLEPFITTTSDNTSWVVENRLYSPCIYQVGSDGKINDVYRTKRLAGDYQAITSLASDGEMLYYTTQAVDTSGKDKSGWSLWQYDIVNNKAKVITEETGIDMVKSISIWQGTVWVSTQNVAGAIVVYQLPITGGVPQETERIWLPEGNYMIGAKYTSVGKTTVLLDSGKTVQIINGTMQDSEMPYQYGHGMSEVMLISSAWLKLRLPIMVSVFVFIMVICLLPIPIISLSRNAKKLLNRIWSVGVLGMLVTYIIAIALLCVQTFSVLGQASLNSSFIAAQQMATLMEQQSKILLTTTQNENPSDWKKIYSLLGAQDELLLMKNGVLSVSISNRAITGTSPNYDLATTTVINDAVEGARGADYSVYRGRLITVSASGIYSSGQLIGVLVTRSGLDNLIDTLFTKLLWLTIAGAGVLLLFTLLLRRMLTKITTPIAQMTNKMDAISNGDLTMWQLGSSHDELDGMGRAMQEMCMSLSIRDYEVDSTITSYRRFVPMGIDKLMGRASVQEVTTGDVRTITGAVALLSVSNRDIARAGLSDDEFVHFVNNCCNTISENLKIHEGYLLSSAFDLTGSKIFFEGTKNQAIASGIEFTGKNKQNNDELLVPNFSILMHHTGLLYGIAGGHDKVFPFTASAELEFLQSYNDQLCQAGAKLVLTEKLVDAVGAASMVRYIGFVSSDDEKYTYKLYEVLGVCSDTQHNMRVRYNDRFQEGIQLFYRNDFYLARNIFSSLLRVAPDDGIVRWYLFACEHYFNCDEQNDVDYRLFGTDKSIN